MPSQPSNIERRLTALETAPHPYCPGPVLLQRVEHLETWEVKQNGTLQELRAEVRDNHRESQELIKEGRLERYEQIGELRRDVNAKIDKLVEQVKWLIGIVLVVAGLVIAAVKAFSV
jgi:hypothetical protein